MALVFLDNFCLTLTGRLDRSDTNLPISSSDANDLCEMLGEDDHSYLTLTTNLGVEIVRVMCNDGTPFIERGQGGTEPLTGSVGRCMCFKVNKLVLDEYQSPEYCEPTIVTNNPDFITITPPEDGECEWTIDLNEEFIERLNECCPEDDCDCGDCVLPNGVYENATITIRNGKVCGIENGRNIVYTGGGSCGCSSNCNCDEE